MQAYKNLEEHFAKIGRLQEVSSLLNWDKSVMMPEKGAAQRGEQLAALEGVIHGFKTNEKIGDLLAAVDEKKLNDWQKSNLRMMRRIYTHATAVSARTVGRKIAQETRTEIIWRGAREKNDFKTVLPELEKLVDIVREEAAEKSDKLKLSPYDALMDHYAPDMRVKEVDVIFDDLAAFLPPFITAVMEHQKQPLDLKGPFPTAVQEKLGRQLAEFLGFDFSWGRLDISAHPFSTGGGGDIRITTRYNEDDFLNSIQGVTHEAGHAFFDRHTPEEWQHQPVGVSQNMGMAIHESQSLSLDMYLGRSLEYWQFLEPHIQKAFGKSGAEWSAENIHRVITRVERGFIRVDADEVTYPAHVILRYRLEKDLIGGKLKVKDLPEAWNALMKELIGAVPPNDRLGCLQDIHWYGGSFGYFPAYALGAMIAAQFVTKMECDIPNVWSSVRQGKFGVFTGWLKDNVQQKACLYSPMDMIERVTGERLNACHYKKHLSKRYLGSEGKASCTTSAPEAKRRA